MQRDKATSATYDLFVIGGGINGCGIARDAAGRGLRVALAEKGDLASATSSASTKLFHGGLRYLEYFEFRLVREALVERETLLKAMPHISWPMRFVLPVHPGMRFDSDTPTSRLLAGLLPWMKGRRPDWLIRLGLFLYDNMGGRKFLPGTSTLDLTADPAGRPLKRSFTKAFEYSDCWVEDSRLVSLNARDAGLRGAHILTRNEVVAAERKDGLWKIVVQPVFGGPGKVFKARTLVNAAGPWVDEFIRGVAGLATSENVRLVRGSHIVTRRLYGHDKCYFFQGGDGRIVFIIPYETDFTLIGTTDQEHHGDPAEAVCTTEERDYLLKTASVYLDSPLTADDVVWTYSGVRSLYDDKARSATAATRDYVLSLDAPDGEAPMLSIFGGKITTYRRLAENALGKLSGHLRMPGRAWTAGVALPGGDFPIDGFETLVSDLAQEFPFLEARTARRLVRAYGTEAAQVLNGARGEADLGRHFGAGLYECEVNWLIHNEFAGTAEDIVWRRSKLGLRLDRAEIEALDAWLNEQGWRAGAMAAE